MKRIVGIGSISFCVTHLVLLEALLLGTPQRSDAQVGYDSPKGHVEVLGLHRWTLAMLRDSIRHYVPGQDLHDAACMVTLREKLHFSEASVLSLQMSSTEEATKSYLLIKVVEPQQAGRVQWDTRRHDEFSSLLPDYADIVLPLTDSVGGVSRGRMNYWLQAADSASYNRLASRVVEAKRADGERVVRFLNEHRTEKDRLRAMRVLERDGFWVNRMMAASVLRNFPASDSTWWTLVRALRDPHEAVREAAGIALRTLPRRSIDWRPVTSDLRLLLGGTNLPGIQELFTTLADTKVAPALAPQLLRDNADWVLAHLGATTPMASPAAHRLLVQLNGGVDLGASQKAWAAWAAQLGKASSLPHRGAA